MQWRQKSLPDPYNSRKLNFNMQYFKKKSPFIAACFLSVTLVLGTTSFTLAEETDSPDQQALALQNTYSGMTSLTFTFDQITRTGSRQRVGRGEAVFYRYQEPREEGEESIPATQSVMRWHYTEPDTQLIISDGETLSIYTEKDKQLIRTPAKELESDITYAFFAGTRNLLDDFTVQSGNADYLFSSGEELEVLLLVTRQPHNQIRDVQVWFDAELLIHHLVIRDHFDSVTELNFSSLQVDSLAPGDRQELDRITTFPIPPGTEIISR